MDEEELKERERIIATLPYPLPTFHSWEPIAESYHPLKCGSIDGTDVIPHDHGIVRALRAKYKPNNKVMGDPSKTLMVRHISRETSQATLTNVFQKYGELERCRLVRDIVTGFSRGYAFIEYKHKDDAERALREEQSIVINGVVVTVDHELERTLPGWVPRRLGGGFGGRKESGQLRFGGVERPFRRPIPLDSVKLRRGPGKESKQCGGDRYKQRHEERGGSYGKRSHDERMSKQGHSRSRGVGETSAKRRWDHQGGGDAEISGGEKRIRP